MSLILKITNTIVFLFFLGSNLYTIVDEHHVSTPWGQHPTYLTPDYWAFYIWGLTYFLLAGFTVWQWIPNSEEVNITVNDVYSHHYALAAITSALWRTLWSENHLWLSALVILFSYLSLGHLVANLHRARVEAGTPSTLIQRVFVHTPIYLWWHTTGFVLLLNILAIVTHFYDATKPSVWDVIATEVAFLVLLSHAVGTTEANDNHLPGNLVLSWFLFAVAAHQPHPIIRWSAIIVGVIALVYPFKALLRRRTAEETPLLRPDSDV
ncbi:hypothetical protein HK097_001874 [Rhizophlyctis rosea]|uniref:Uncharacterized protein n=1 Tax=Rhizophlyctis rosea TaxID=64517 RepID=A0AAD5X497_9FUNG|nr:hypothetical protein HK097_001874 [Rhizophlyctis rosea]